MQNYQNFIDELFRLDIDTIQYFVKDGQVRYDQLPKYYTAEQLANTPAERLPGYVSTFMSLERYDAQRSENRYADTLVELQRRAVNDLLVLEPTQAKRILIDAKSKCELLTSLLKNALEYQKAWGYDTLDLLSAGFLELKLLNAFVIKSRPEASPHDRFAHHLTDSIVYKRNTLSDFIEQIETALQSFPAINSPIAQEPNYDLWYINNNDKYAFAKLKELAHYLPTIEPFTKRVEWFFDTSRIWEIEPCSLGIGTRHIPERVVFSRNNKEGKLVDENGQYVEEIAWGINCSNDEEKRILRKAYFLKFYLTTRTTLYNKPLLDLDQLIDKYSANRQTERGKRLQMEWVMAEIRDRQTLINEMIEDNKKDYYNRDIKKQTQNAAVLIEQELEGIPAIKWELIIKIDQLKPFASLWGLVEYKRFLEMEDQPAPIISAPLIINEWKNNKPASTTGFASYIEEEHRARLMPYLTERYTNQKPEEYGFMLYALDTLKYVPISKINANQSKAHRALEVTFGQVGSRANLNIAIRRLNPREVNELDKLQIEQHTQHIHNYLQSLPTD